MRDYDVAAYIWPAYTGTEPRTRIFWPEGNGEWESVRKEWARMDAEFTVPYFPHVSVGWDNNPRFERFRPGIVKNNAPGEIAKALRAARDYVDAHPNQPPRITVNSWNEWTETSYLQPDDLYGYGYLEAIRSVFVSQQSPAGESQKAAPG